MANEDDPVRQAWTEAENFLLNDETDWRDDTDQLIERAERAGIPPGAMLTLMAAYLSDIADECDIAGDEMLVAVAFNRAAAKDETGASAGMREALDWIVKKRGT